MNDFMLVVPSCSNLSWLEWFVGLLQKLHCSTNVFFFSPSQYLNMSWLVNDTWPYLVAFYQWRPLLNTTIPWHKATHRAKYPDIMAGIMVGILNSIPSIKWSGVLCVQCNAIWSIFTFAWNNGVWIAICNGCTTRVIGCLLCRCYRAHTNLCMQRIWKKNMILQYAERRGWKGQC